MHGDAGVESSQDFLRLAGPVQTGGSTSKWATMSMCSNRTASGGQTPAPQYKSSWVLGVWDGLKPPVRDLGPFLTIRPGDWQAAWS